MEILPKWVTIGFSAATSHLVERHVLQSWEFSSSLVVKEKSSQKGRLIIGLTVSGVVLVARLVLIMTFVVLRKRKQKNKGIAETENLTSMNYDLERGAGVPRRFSYVDLASATNNFSGEKKLGEGGFGAIYRGYLRDLGMVVAVKKISRGSKQGKKEYITKVKVISCFRHRNLVQPIGWCHDRGEFLLVYEFMPNGSLMWDPFPNFVPREGPRGSHVISPSAFGPSKVRAEPITDPRRSIQSDPNHNSWGSEATRVCYLGAAARDSWGSEAPRVCYLGTAAPYLNSQKGQKPRGSSDWIQWKATHGSRPRQSI
ncbi:Tyrosine-protein kinase [Parasponia andersonii]|uniref:Tyrosine-protein kinase n=1 Tax=Parasponia andersonii TaxID=3476 RepID=A0A2P5A4U9_PARAD|nr:Tyrosine-protein kinase [Parasponia andersonii]